MRSAGGGHGRERFSDDFGFAEPPSQGAVELSTLQLCPIGRSASSGP